MEEPEAIKSIDNCDPSAIKKEISPELFQKIKIEYRACSKPAILCLFCRNESSKDLAQKYPHGLQYLFEQFCNYFHIPSPLKVFSEFEDLQLCGDCELKVVDMASLENSVKDLTMRLAELKGSLKRSIIETWDQDFHLSQQQQPTAKATRDALRRYFTQSVSECKIVLKQVESEDVPKIRPKRRLKKSFKPEFVEISHEHNESMSEPEVSLSDGDINEDYNQDDDALLQNALSTKRKRRRKTGETQTIYTCKRCEQKLPSRPQLVKHLEEEHGVVGQFCLYCTSEFIPEYLADGSTLAERPYKCHLDGCSLAYLSLHDLRRHHLTKCPDSPTVRSKATVYPCSQCEAVYSSKVALVNHVRRDHEQKLNFRCESCGKGFLNKSIFQRHYSIVHSTEKPFKCDLCPCAFKQKAQLVTHRRTHTGELPFMCEMCGKGFRSKERQRLHVGNVHVDLQVPCPVCGRTFRSKHYVARHIADTHDKKRRRSRKKKVEAVKDSKISHEDSHHQRPQHESEKNLEDTTTDFSGTLSLILPMPQLSLNSNDDAASTGRE